MRDCIVKIDNNGKATVTQPIEYIEEHAATRLVITLNSELKSSTVSYYTLCFKPGAALKNPPDVKITSDIISASQVSNGTINYDLPSELTCFGSLDVQVQAHVIDSNDRMVSLIKSPVFRLYFEPSITGDEEILIGEGEGFISLIHSALAQLNLTVEEVEELCDKLTEAFENGELNGPVMMPSVSADGTLSWSNDAGLDNPLPVNIKGPKGDKGDKGDKGEDGVFSDELAEEITLNTAARHTHGNKELLDSLTESMIGTLNVYHELPETANDGDICIYSPANVLTAEDSGKLIHVDWDAFNKTLAEDFVQFAINFFDASEEVGYMYATSWSNENGNYSTLFQYIKGNEQWDIQFLDGVFDQESSAYTNGETTTYFDAPPASFTLPDFSDLISDHSNINGDVLYAPIKLMVYRDGWYEFKATTGGQGLTEEQKEIIDKLGKSGETLTFNEKKVVDSSVLAVVEEQKQLESLSDNSLLCYVLTDRIGFTPVTLEAGVVYGGLADYKDRETIYIDPLLQNFFSCDAFTVTTENVLFDEGRNLYCHYEFSTDGSKYFYYKYFIDDEPTWVRLYNATDNMLIVDDITFPVGWSEYFVGDNEASEIPIFTDSDYFMYFDIDGLKFSNDDYFDELQNVFSAERTYGKVRGYYQYYNSKWQKINFAQISINSNSAAESISANAEAIESLRKQFAAFEGEVTEIETMIDESGVLDE